MKTYHIEEDEYLRVEHGNRSIKIQKPVANGEWILFMCPYKVPIQAKVKSIRANGAVFKTTAGERVAEFPFPIED